MRQDQRPAGPPRSRHRPLIPVVAGFAAGIAVDGLLSPRPWAWPALGACTVVLVLWGLRRGLKGWGHWTLALFLLVPAGGLWHELRFRDKPPNHLKNLPLGGGAYYHMRAEVERAAVRHLQELPFALEGASAQVFYLLPVEATAVSADGGEWTATAGGLSVFFRGGEPGLLAGDRVQFFARLRHNRPPGNPGERDRRLLYERHGSYGTASVSSPEGLRLLRKGSWFSSPRVAIERLRTFFRRRLARTFRDPESRGLVTALLFGQRSALTSEQEDLLRESGALHFLAISGLHVGIFCFFVSAGLALAGMPVRLRILAAVGLVWLYVVFTGLHVSAARAAWMLTFIMAAPLLERRTDALSALLAAALLILVLSPQQLFNAGFQLTFVAVWGLVCIYPQVADLFWPWEDLVARLQRPEERTVAGILWRWGRAYLLLSCVLWAVTAPLRAYHFHTLSLLTPLVNLVLWPLVLFLLITCFLLAPATLLGGPVAGLLSGAAVRLSGAMEVLLGGFARLPGFSTYVTAPALWWVGLFYLFSGVWVTRRRLPAGRRLFLGGTCLLAVGLVVPAVTARADADFRLTIADVGPGQAVVAEVPSGQTLLFDAGSRRTSARRAVGELLWQRRRGRIDAAVVSHGNLDHCSFLPFLARRFGIGRLLVGPSWPAAGLSRRLRKWALRAEVALRHLAEGARIRAGALRCTVLHPSPRFASNAKLPLNEKSLVLLCRYRGFSFLLPGDVEDKALQRLTAREGTLRADLLVMPHHGRYHRGLEDLLDRVKPRLVVVSGTSRTCDLRTRQALSERGLRPWVTGSEGAVTVTVCRGKARAEAFKSGRVRRLPLAGPTTIQPGGGNGP